ncbi:MAG TPA: class I SAM-dependent methyltransferase [Solirubrobacteraceae bacterium]|nr:class I SAM-dependent methyltransferase [Solirubrobacteraceae bacterium]
MRWFVRLWTLWARLRQRHAWRRGVRREELVQRFASGRTFADVGAMWQVDGAIAFLAEQCGARAITAVDLMAPTGAYAAEHARRSSGVRFVEGDVHDPAVVAEIGPHDVVWCSGVLYHSPNPLLTLQRLRSITTETLILATETIPEVPGLAGACVFWPGLAQRDRRLHARARPSVKAVGLDSAFEPWQSYEAWWWGISRTALRGMLLASGFEVREEYGGPLHATVIAVPS